MEMKIKRQLKLSQALDEITRYVESLRSGSVEFNDKALRPDDDVELHIEFESKDGELELEFEIKWEGEKGPAQPAEQTSASTEGVPNA